MTATTTVHTAPPSMAGVLTTSARCGGCTEPVSLNTLAETVRLAGTMMLAARPLTGIENTRLMRTLRWDCPGCGAHNVTDLPHLC